jgi:hypothetical protein
MKRRGGRLLAALVWLTVGVAVSSSQISPELAGTWDYTSLTALRDGKPFGTAHFHAGQWTLKLNADATWVMQGPTANAKPVNGTYEVHGSTLKMNGGNESEYHFSLKKGGKVLQLKDKGSMISATRE